MHSRVPGGPQPREPRTASVCRRAKRLTDPAGGLRAAPSPPCTPLGPHTCPQSSPPPDAHLRSSLKPTQPGLVCRRTVAPARGFQGSAPAAHQPRPPQLVSIVRRPCRPDRFQNDCFPHKKRTRGPMQDRPIVVNGNKKEAWKTSQAHSCFASVRSRTLD